MTHKIWIRWDESDEQEKKISAFFHNEMEGEKEKNLPSLKSIFSSALYDGVLKVWDFLKLALNPHSVFPA